MKWLKRRQPTIAHFWHCNPDMAFCGWDLSGDETANTDTEFDDSRDEDDCPLCVVIYYTNGGCTVCGQ